MKKLVATTLAMTLGLGSIVLTEGISAEAATSKTVKVSGAYVTNVKKNVYKSAASKKIGTVNKHKKVKLLYKKKVNGKNWYKISYNNGHKGWVVGSNMKRLTVSAAKTYKKTYKTLASKNYYNLAGGHHNILGRLAKGKTVSTSHYRKVNGNGWVKVKGYGWTPISNLKTVTQKTSAKVATKKTSASSNSIINYGERFLGVPYVWGGSTTRGFDCSGFTSYVYRNVLGISLPRTSKSQYASAKKVSKANLKVGDLVFFNTSGSGVSHVAIYAGNNKLLHAAGKKVKYSNLYDGYWNVRVVGYGTYR